MSLYVDPLLSPWPSRLQATRLVIARAMKGGWACPSDHIPVRVLTFDGVLIISWNVLSRHYMHWIYTNDQGLNDSILTRQHETIVDSSGLTAREDLIVQYVIMMMNRPEVVIMCLQECSAELLAALKRRAVGYHFTELQDVRSGTVTILDTDKVAQVIDVDVYLDSESESIESGSMVAVDVMLLSLATIRIVNVHLAAGIMKHETRQNFVRRVLKPPPPERTIVIGDYNARPETMQMHMRNEAADGVYMCVVPSHPTCIARDQSPQVIDFAICNRFTNFTMRASWRHLRPEEIPDPVARWVAPFGDTRAREQGPVAISGDDTAMTRCDHETTRKCHDGGEQ